MENEIWTETVGHSDLSRGVGVGLVDSAKVTLVAISIH